jgi:hypothetical protein
MFNILHRVYDSVKENHYISKSNEMLSIAQELYKLSRAKDNLPKKKTDSRVKYLEQCYLTAVANVTKNEDESLKKRWDVRILSNGVQKVETISKKCENVSKNIYKRAERFNEKVRWTGREFNEQLKKRAKSVEYARKAVYKRVKSQQKRVQVAFTFGKELAKKTYTNTRKKTVELRLKLHKKVDSLVIAPAKNLSSNCVKKVKPYYSAARTKVGELASHSQQAVFDIKDSLVETSLEYTKPLRARTIDLMLPVMSENMKLAKDKYQNTRQMVVKRMEPVTETVRKNKACMKRLFGFTWELFRNAMNENVELVRQIALSNKEFFNQYMSDVDLEVYYAKNKSLSVRELFVAWTGQLMKFFVAKEAIETNNVNDFEGSVQEENVGSDMEKEEEILKPEEIGSTKSDNPVLVKE